MESLALKEQFEQLNKLLKDEREAAISLDMEALEQSTLAKKELLANLESFPKDTDGLRDLLLEVDKENRRNAYLLWAGLGWVREMMGFFGQSTNAQAYGGAGQSLNSKQKVHLLTGKV